MGAGFVWITLDRLLDPRDAPKDRQENCQICAVINLAVYTYNTLMTEQAITVFHHLTSRKYCDLYVGNVIRLM
jgi:hypothetical protein